MTNELPGLYRVDGIKAAAKSPNGTKFKTVVPLEHIAYNIVLPRVGKRIDRNNYRKKIRENIRAVEFDENCKYGGQYLENQAGIKISSSQMRLGRMGCVLSKELGHVFSAEYSLPQNPDISEYYGYVGQKIGEEELKDTRFSFRADDNGKRGLTNDKDVQEDVRTAVEHYAKMVKKKIPQKRLEKAFRMHDKLDVFVCELTENIIDEAKSTGKLNINKLNAAKEEADYIAEKIGKTVRMEFDSLKDTTDSVADLFRSTGFYHLKGYSLAEAMYENFGAKGSFKYYKKIFATRGGKVRLKTRILEKLPEKDKEKLKELEEKTAGISYFWFARARLFHDLQAILD